MKKKKIAFFDAKPYDVEIFDEVNNGEFVLKYFPRHLNSDTAYMARDYDGVCAFVNDKIDKKVIKEFFESGIKIIALRSAGYNNVDIKAAYEKLHVTIVPAYSPNAVAEHTTALMLSLNRRIHKAYYRTKDNKFSINGFLGFDMKGKTVGVIGTGKIGKAVIKIMRGFEAEVLAYDKYEDGKYAKKEGFEYTTLDRLFKKFDIVTLHCPLTKETEHLINADNIKKMKKGVMVVNTGRGRLIDIKALIQGLKSKKIGYAGLDVYEEEDKYFFEDFSEKRMGDDVLARLHTFNNVIITSHQDFFTKEAITAIAETTLKNLREAFRGKTLTNEICYRCGEKPVKKRKTGNAFERLKKHIPRRRYYCVQRVWRRYV
ncbi:MAG TPA: 2-hydroxyacid dehydrogenase, partial [Firmicutes bacterium]|nr:2-hydroxyacid dehydrogenase [Bacillota bacterium]